MKRKRHTEEQIIAILKEHEAGVKMADLRRKHGISEASFYNWKAKYGGLEVSEAKRLKGLESENARLKKLLADAMLDAAGHAGGGNRTGGAHAPRPAAAAAVPHRPACETDTALSSARSRSSCTPAARSCRTHNAGERQPLAWRRASPFFCQQVLQRRGDELQREVRTEAVDLGDVLS